MSNDPPPHRGPDPALFDTPGEALDAYAFFGGSVWAAIVCALLALGLGLAPILFPIWWVAAITLGALVVIALAFAAWQVVALVALTTEREDPQVRDVLMATPAAMVVLIGVFAAWTAFGWLEGSVDGSGAHGMHWLEHGGAWLEARIHEVGDAAGLDVAIDVSEGGDRSRQLAQAGELYLWETANTIPLLDIPDTIGWKRTDAYSGTLVGALVLAFRLLVLVAVVRVAVVGYEWARATYWPRQPLVPAAAWATKPVQDKGIIARACKKAGRAGLVVFPLVVVTALSATTVHLVARALPPGWALALMLLIAVAALVWVLLRAFRALPDRWIARPGAVVAARIAILVAAFEIFAATSAILLGAGVLSTTEPVAAGNRVEAAEAFYLWHAVNAVPALDIPATLEWRLDAELEGLASALMLLAFKAAVAVPVLAAVAAILRSGSHERA